ncbi:MAG: universal stress protein, partial [Chloroflexi bacterium]|nr:universal stress protein [Chloroflexota bacterium]
GSMYEKILVPLDGSELAEAAVPYAEGVARRLKNELALVTACAPGDPMGQLYRGYLDKMAGRLRTGGVTVTVDCIEGEVAPAILKCAERDDIGLVLLSARGKGGESRLPLGSIATKIVQGSRKPVLLVKSPPPASQPSAAQLRRVLVPLDGSQFAEQILTFIWGLAPVDTEIVLLRVVEPHKLPRFMLLSRDAARERLVKQFTALAEEQARWYLGYVEKSLSQKCHKVRSQVLVGKPADAILGYVQDGSSDLIALATHGFTGISRLAYGSVGLRLIESSPIPVLVVRPPLPRAGR